MPFDEEWHLFVEALWEYQYVQKECPLTEQLSRALHDISYGIIDIANRIYLAAQVRAIEKGTEEITEGLLRSAYRDDFRLISHIIETLKTGDPSLLHNIRDVCPPVIIPIKERAVNSSAYAGKEQKVEWIEREGDTEGDPRGHLPSPSIEGATSIGQQTSDTQRDEIWPSSTQPTITTRKPKRRSRKSNAIGCNFDVKDLRCIVGHDQAPTPQLDPHSALQAAGYIKDSTEFLPKDC